MLKVAIVGCGKVAEQHAEHVLYLEGCRLVAVCDREPIMARNMAERMQVPHSFTSVEEMLAVAGPDVVHITTPPQSHFALGKLCLQAGAAPYIEKPFTVDATEAEELIRLAGAMNVKLTVGHNQQFSNVAREMRQLVADGYLGGTPVHVESYDGYDLGDVVYAKALLNDHRYWVRQLPGGLLQNNMSHGISKIAEFLRGDRVTVKAHGFTSAALRSVGETSIIDEVRVILDDGFTTGYYTFTTQMRPVLEQLRLYGPANGLVVDTTDQTLIKLRGTPYRSFLQQFMPPRNYARQHRTAFRSNVRKFLRAELHPDHGKRALIQSFYRSVAENAPLPIPYREILLTSRIMDDVFAQLDQQRRTTEFEHHAPAAALS